jgi:mRNA-degrading endonuclease RelE of RelBE toxin-antitoxin system
MWKNEDVGACPCYPTNELLRTLDKVVDQIEELGVKYLAFNPGDLYKNVDKTMEDAGFKKLGEGLTRLVYEFKDEKNCRCVVKVSKSKAARVSNYNEVAVMIDAPENIRDLFLRLGAADEDGWWVTQPEASFPEKTERYEIAAGLRGKLDYKGWNCLDLHSDNVGLYANAPVIVNYGFGLNCTQTGTFLGSKGAFRVVESPTSSPRAYRKFEFTSKGLERDVVWKQRAAKEPAAKQPKAEEPAAPGMHTAWPSYLSREPWEVSSSEL